MVKAFIYLFMIPDLNCYLDNQTNYPPQQWQVSGFLLEVKHQAENEALKLNPDILLHKSPSLKPFRFKSQGLWLHKLWRQSKNFLFPFMAVASDIEVNQKSSIMVPSYACSRRFESKPFSTECEELWTKSQFGSKSARG